MMVQPIVQCGMKKQRTIAKALMSALMLAILLCSGTAQASAVRIKDIVDIDGVRDNMLVGYGLVVGLNGTGDSLSNSPFTAKSLVGMLERLGINTRGDSLKTKNVAAVMVTATLPPFSAQGTRIDVTVSTLGDAKSLSGGTLLVTPLMGADGEVYAVGQGSLVIGGFTAAGNAASVTKGVPTTGRIASGAIIEREINFQLADMPNLRLNLRNPDFTTAKRIADVVNKEFGSEIAIASDRSNVTVAIHDKSKNKLVSLITRIEQLEVTPDEVAKVVIDEQSGVIIMGDNVRISRVAIAQGNLTVRITETPQVSQPGALSNGTTQTVDRTDIDVSEGEGKKLAVFSPGVTLQELVHSLNALGIGPRDMITILQSIKAAGALQAEIQVI
ncbi:MAG: flagellar basal body P-ring protein FlgI [Alphaproteobacteria bacterium]|nr:flagellar basal body P-ring protein FlgI [Alphaproteobacteria bacterium]